MEDPEISKIIDFKRQEKGLTYKDLGSYLNISGDAIRKAIKENRLKPYYIDRLSEYLEINKKYKNSENSENSTTEPKVEYYKKGVSLLEIRDDIKSDLLDIKKNSAKKQHIQALSDSLAENFESITGALLKILQHNEKVEDFMDQIDLKALKDATKSLNK